VATMLPTALNGAHATYAPCADIVLPLLSSEMSLVSDHSREEAMGASLYLRYWVSFCSRSDPLWRSNSTRAFQRVWGTVRSIMNRRSILSISAITRRELG
jgi:hypothetical protein